LGFFFLQNKNEKNVHPKFVEPFIPA